MIVSRAPLRVSLFGGGTDFKEFYYYNKTAILSMAINKYVYIIIKKRLSSDIYIYWSKKKEICKNVNEIEHDLIRESLIKANIFDGVEIICLSDVPGSGTGLGSSSSFTIAALNAAFTYNGIQKSSYELAKIATEIEIDVLKKPIGIQDQYISALGGIQLLVMGKKDKIKFNNLYSNNLHSKFINNLFLVYSGSGRKSENILSDQKKLLKKNNSNLKKLSQYAYDGKKLLKLKKYDSIGKLLNDNWNIKKKLSNKITNNRLDKIYNNGLKNGALGGKICGAGKGGYMLFYVPKSNHDIFIEKFRKDILNFHVSKNGASIILNDG